MMLVGTWLKGIGLDYAIPTFEAAGIVTPDAFSELDPQHFEALGVHLPDDRRKLFYLVQRVKVAQKSERAETTASGAGEVPSFSASSSSAPAPDDRGESSPVVSSTSAKATAISSSLAHRTGTGADGANSKIAQPSHASRTTKNNDMKPSASHSGAVAPRREGRMSTSCSSGGEPDDVLRRSSSASGGDTATINTARSIDSTEDSRDGTSVNGGQNRRRRSSSSSAANSETRNTTGARRLSGLPAPKKRTSLGGEVGDNSSSTNSGGTSVSAGAEASSSLHNHYHPRSMRTGKVLSSIPSESVAPMSPLVDLSLRAQDQHQRLEHSRPVADEETARHEIGTPGRPKSSMRSQFRADVDGGSNDGECSFSIDRRSVGCVTQRSSRRNSNLLRKSESADATRSASTATATASFGSTASSTEHRLARGVSLSSSGTMHSEASSSNSFAAQIERLREVNAAAAPSSANPYIDPGQRVNVVVRKRPATNDVDMLHVLPPNRVLVYQPRTRVDLRREISTVPFRFDAAFDESVSNADVYEFAVQPLIPPLVDGQNATVFCFGQTNSGKTHTLLGKFSPRTDGIENEDGEMPAVQVHHEPGLYYLAARDIFDAIGESEEFDATVSLLELYDRKVLDLLNNRASVPCWEDGAGKVQFPGLTLHSVSSADQLQRLVEQGHSLRSIGTTSKNNESSRSHAVLQLHLNETTTRRPRKQGRYATMTFIDLAGSERGADTALFSSATRMEGAEINTSLLALKEVLRAMSSNESTHIPFRGSKLTQILKESLVDSSSSCVMIACVCPNLGHCEPSLNTLRYASCLKEFEKSKDSGRRGEATNPAQATGHRSRTPPPRAVTDAAPPKTILDSPPPFKTPPPSSLPARANSGASEVSTDASAMLDDILSSPGDEVINLAELSDSPDRRKQAAQQLFRTHKDAMTGMLALVKDEMTFVCNHVGDCGKNSLQYIMETRRIQDLQLSHVNVLREALLQLREATGRHRDEAINIGQDNNESFEDLRD